MLVTASSPVISRERNPNRARPVTRSSDFSHYLSEAVAANSNQRISLPATGLPDVLDLSIFAQLLLTQIPAGPGFILTDAEAESLAHIITVHRGQALTLDNFTALMDDLRKAGIAPDQLAAQDQLRFFDLTLLLLEAADGSNPGIDFAVALGRLPIPFAPNEKENINRYLLYVIGLWQGITPGQIGASQQVFA
ncbi:MAG: hypothetical protein EBV03_00735 [Proteobacteria bacterium]|nr:hypothetical protein [Pseudomonadota bacterium]